MRLYDNAWPSCYEEIKTWYPVWYRDVAEMDALWRAWGRQLDEAQRGIIQAVDNHFVTFADAQAVAKLEAFLGIVYDGPRTLAERRNVVRAFMRGQGHIGQKEIKALIAVFTEGGIEVDLVGGTIQITVTRDLGDRFNLYDCHLVLDNRIPAHLVLGLVDNILPIASVNHSRLIFRAIRAGVCFQEATVRVVGPMLNSVYQLDSPHLLDATYPGIQFMNLSVAVAARQAFRLAATWTTRSRWTLNGAVLLDGSYPLRTRQAVESA